MLHEGLRMLRAAKESSGAAIGSRTVTVSIAFQKASRNSGPHTFSILSELADVEVVL
jgi:hypothetical protein